MNIVRLILSIIFAVLIVLFIGFNLQNVCNISIVFHTFENVHVFMPVLIAFVAGILFMLPFVIVAKGGSKRSKKNRSVNQASPEKKDATKNQNVVQDTEKKVERVHPENETEYVPTQHLDEKAEK